MFADEIFTPKQEAIPLSLLKAVNSLFAFFFFLLGRVIYWDYTSTYINRPV